jgi:hypothetical protein
MALSSRAAACRNWGARAALLALPLCFLALFSGCNPASLAFLMMPFVDDKEPAKCKLSNPTRDTTVAIVTWFGNSDLQLYSELTPFDNELSEKLATALHDRFVMNKEKVKIVPHHQVRVYQNKVASKSWSPSDLGKKLKADYVIAMEINSLTLYARGSSNQLFQGNTEVDVKVYDLSKPEYDQVIFNEIYQRTYPKDNPIDASGSVMQFRALFLRHMTRELSRWFSPYTHDEKIYSMESD